MQVVPKASNSSSKPIAISKNAIFSSTPVKPVTTASNVVTSQNNQNVTGYNVIAANPLLNEPIMNNKLAPVLPSQPIVNFIYDHNQNLVGAFDGDIFDKSAGLIDSLNVTLEKTKPVFYSNEVLVGAVHLRVVERIRVSQVRVTMIGDGKVKWYIIYERDLLFIDVLI